MIDLSLSSTLIMFLKHELYGLNYVLHLQKVPNWEKPQKVESPFRDYAGHQATIDHLPVWVYSIL